MSSHPQNQQPTPRADMNLETVLNAAPEDALMLGVDGHDEQANARRAQIATTVDAEFRRLEDRAYRQAAWNDEPDLIQPFGTRFVAIAGGDLRHVVDAHTPALVYQLLHRQGLFSERHVDDEDGARWEKSFPSDESRRDAEQEVANIRRVLAERGVLSPEYGPAGGMAGAAHPTCPEYHPPSPDQSQSSGDVGGDPWSYPLDDQSRHSIDDGEIDPPF